MKIATIEMRDVSAKRAPPYVQGKVVFASFYKSIQDHQSIFIYFHSLFFPHQLYYIFQTLNLSKIHIKLYHLDFGV